MTGRCTSFGVTGRMAKNLCRLPPEWCNYISQLCQQFDDKQPSPPSRITFGDCPQRLESYVQTPLMYLMPPIILWSPLEQFSMMKTKLCTCPKCNSGEVILHPSTWRDGTKSRRSELTSQSLWGRRCDTFGWPCLYMFERPRSYRLPSQYS